MIFSIKCPYHLFESLFICVNLDHLRHLRAEINLNTAWSRILEKLSLTDLQTAFAEFINALLPETELIAAVDGKGSSL